MSLFRVSKMEQVRYIYEVSVLHSLAVPVCPSHHDDLEIR